MKNVKLDSQALDTLYNTVKENGTLPVALKILMQLTNITTSDIASEVGVHPSTIRRYIRGTMFPSYETFEKLIKIL